jgi:hypothetical protein
VSKFGAVVETAQMGIGTLVVVVVVAVVDMDTAVIHFSLALHTLLLWVVVEVAQV